MMLRPITPQLSPPLSPTLFGYEGIVSSSEASTEAKDAADAKDLERIALPVEIVHKQAGDPANFSDSDGVAVREGCAWFTGLVLATSRDVRLWPSCIM